MDIKVSEYFQDTLSSRDAIAVLFNRRFEPYQSVILDFSNIHFITRAAAHQLIKETERVNDRFHCKVNSINTSEDINAMLNIVKSSNTIINRPHQSFKYFELLNKSDMKRFFEEQ